MCPHRNLQQKEPAKRRVIPSISKTREAEIRKALRANLQKTRQRVRNVMSPARVQVLITLLQTVVCDPRRLWFCSSASLVQQTRPVHGPVWGQHERGSLQEAEGGDGEEGKSHWAFSAETCSCCQIFDDFCLAHRWVTTSQFLQTARRLPRWGKSALNQVSEQQSTNHLVASQKRKY